MRIAEILMAIALAALSLAIMYKAGERPSWSGEARFSNVWFGEDGAPQGGFWPFWVCAILFLCSVWVMVNGILKLSPVAKREEPYLDRHGINVLLTVGLPVFLLVLLTDHISMYFSMALFLFYYLFVLGRHGLILSAAMATVFPFWMFLFFDITMTSTLPKGSLWVEDSIYVPLGNWFRQTESTAIWVSFSEGFYTITSTAITTVYGFLIGAVIVVVASILSRRGPEAA